MNFQKIKKKKIINREFKGKNQMKDVAGRKINKKNVEVDHIVPASKGGKATLKNGTVLHPKTNKEKSDKLSGTFGPKSNQRTFKVNKKSKNPKIITKKKK